MLVIYKQSSTHFLVYRIIGSVLQDDADKMITHLASLAKQKLIIRYVHESLSSLHNDSGMLHNMSLDMLISCSFAPKTLKYTILKRIGELFPGPAKVMADMHVFDIAFIPKDCNNKKRWACYVAGN